MTHVANADLLTNGNFNTNSVDPGLPDAWTNWMYGPTAFAAFKNDAANDPFDFDGTGYVNAGNYGEWWSSGGGWYQEVAGSEGVAYSFAAFCATEDWDYAAGELRLIYLDGGGNELRRDVRHSASYQANLPWSPFILTSVAPATTATVKVELATWGARGTVLWDEASLHVASVWNVDNDGNAGDASNWLGGAPGGVDAAARFLDIATAPRTITLDAPLTLGSMSFANAQTYLLDGSALRLETSAGYAILDVQAGTQRVAVPMTLASDGYFAVAGGATLEIAGPLTVSAGKTVRPSGGGSISYQSSVALEDGASISFAENTSLSSLSLAAGASVSLAAHGTGAANDLNVAELNMAADARIDLTDNALVVSYAGTSPVGTIRDLIQSAFNAGAWDGPGVSSSAISAGQRLGYADSGDALSVRLAVSGDATLDDAVGFDDLMAVARNYGIAGGAIWATGDFDYDGAVDFSDLLTLAQNFGVGPAIVTGDARLSADFVTDWHLALSVVPEPSAFVFVGVIALLARRRCR